MPLHPSLLHFWSFLKDLPDSLFFLRTAAVAGIRRTGMLTGLAQILRMPRILTRDAAGRIVFSSARLGSRRACFRRTFSCKSACISTGSCAACGFEFALNVVQTTPEVNAPQRAHRAFQPLGRELFVFFQQDGREPSPVAFGKRQLHHVGHFQCAALVARRPATRLPIPSCRRSLSMAKRACRAGSNSSSAPSRAERCSCPLCISCADASARTRIRSASVICASTGAFDGSCRSAGRHMLQFLAQHRRVDAQLLRDLVRELIANDAAGHALDMRAAGD